MVTSYALHSTHSINQSENQQCLDRCQSRPLDGSSPVHAPSHGPSTARVDHGEYGEWWWWYELEHVKTRLITSSTNDMIQIIGKVKQVQSRRQRVAPRAASPPSRVVARPARFQWIAVVGPDEPLPAQQRRGRGQRPDKVSLFFKRCIRLRSCNACIQQHVTGDGPNDVPLIVSGGSRSRDEKRCTNGSCDDRPHEEAAAPIPGLSPAASCSPRAGLFSCIPFIR
jgi:hypothetical protein